MIPSIFVVVLVSALSGVSAEADCEIDDHRCSAEYFAAQAQETTNAAHRVKYLLAALRQYEAAGENADLCAAFALLLKEDEDEDEEKNSDLAKRRQVLRERLSAEGTECTSSTKFLSLGEGSPRVELLEAKIPNPEVAKILSRVTFDGSDYILDNPTAKARSGRGLRIAGAATLAIGLGLVSTASYAGARMALVRREGTALVEGVTAMDPMDPMAVARDAAFRQEYRTMGNLTLGAGISGGVAVIVGAVLVGVGSRQGQKNRRKKADIAVSPGTRGFVFSARF